jgi:hypothetical protein
MGALSAIVERDAVAADETAPPAARDPVEAT